MARLGEERAKARDAQARSADVMSITPAGRAILRKLVEPAIESLDRWLEEALSKTQPPVAAPLLELVGTEKAALLSAQAVVDGCHRPRRLTSVIASIGRSLEDEYRFSQLAKNNPGVFKEGKKRLKKLRPKRRRRIFLGLARWHGGMPDKWPKMRRLRLGAVCLDAIMVNKPDLAEIQNWRDGRKTHAMLVPKQGFLRWLEDSVDAAAVLSPFHMPCIDKPRDWDGPTGGGYLTELVYNRPVARFRAREQQKALTEEGNPEAQYTALNRLQSTEWEVSADVFETFESLWEVARDGDVAGLPAREDEMTPPFPEQGKEDPKVLESWKKQAAFIHHTNAVRRSRRALVAITRNVCKRFLDRPFYFPHRLDFRGRAYPTPYFLQPQGPDVVRGLIRFHKKAYIDPSDKESLRWWLLHGAGMWGAKGTLDYREGFAVDHLLPIAKDVHQDPFHNREWENADEPWQFLAWCLEAGDWAEGDILKTHIPVQVDASNNGLQLFALMTGDRKLAEMTNAIPSPDGDEPKDIYAEVARRATERLHEHDSDLAKQWIDFLGEEGVPRDCAKRPVMTLPYGVTLWSAQRYVRDWYKEQCGRSGPFGDVPGKAAMLLARLIMQEVKAVCSGAVAAMSWLQEVSSVCTKRGLACRWISPAGWPVVQHYKETKARMLKADLAGTVRQLTIREPHNRKVDGRKHSQGVAPNFVHSVDAAVLASALGGWPEGRPITAIHDAFGCLAPDMGGPDGLRARLVDVVARNAIEAMPLEALADYVRKYARTGRYEIPSPPKFGTIKPEEVRAAEYMFS